MSCPKVSQNREKRSKSQRHRPLRRDSYHFRGEKSVLLQSYGRRVSSTSTSKGQDNNERYGQHFLLCLERGVNGYKEHSRKNNLAKFIKCNALTHKPRQELVQLVRERWSLAYDLVLQTSYALVDAQLGHKG